MMDAARQRIRGSRWHANADGRECSLCGVFKPWAEFHTKKIYSTAGAIGPWSVHHSGCMACRLERYHHPYHSAARSVERRKSALYRAAHRDELNARRRTRRADPAYQARERALSKARRAARRARRVAALCAVIIEEICAYVGLDRAEVLGPSRDAEMVQARWLAMLLLRRTARLTYTEIGDMLGRDHSTVIHGLAQARAQMRRDRRRVSFGPFARAEDAISQAVAARRAADPTLYAQPSHHRTSPVPVRRPADPVARYWRLRATGYRGQVAYAAR